ncbi:odorant receptor 67c-like [Anticarsia gemmatalis]|uniref:odorant receptor 67c-like n=1 Tax=Anticarsia gemmatalis TaxID=129554 RepID=UPI003F75DE04
MVTPTLLIDKTVQKIAYLFRCTGINIKIGEKTRKDKFRCLFIYILNFIWLNIDVGGAYYWFFVGVAEHKDFTELTYVAPCMLTSTLGNLKTFYMIIHEGTVETLMNIMRKLEVDHKNDTGDAKIDEIIKTEDNYVNRVINILNVFYVILIICFALSPLMLVLLNYMRTNEVELLLPFLVIYPFDPFDMRYYPWMYLHQIWSEVVVFYGICASDFMLYIFCTYLRMQFNLLKYHFEEIIPDTKNGSIPNLEEAKLKLVELIKWHQELLSSAEILEVLYTRPTLFNFVLSSIILCLTGFNVMAIDDGAIVLTFLFFFLTILLQIFFLCFFADRLTESSMEVSDAIYNSRWYLAEPALAKTLLVIQIRSQTPCKLTASNFADVTLKAFMKICSTAWSYFALLQTMYSAPPQ